MTRSPCTTDVSAHPRRPRGRQKAIRSQLASEMTKRATPKISAGAPHATATHKDELNEYLEAFPKIEEVRCQGRDHPRRRPRSTLSVGHGPPPCSRAGANLPCEDTREIAL